MIPDGQEYAPGAEPAVSVCIHRVSGCGPRCFPPTFYSGRYNNEGCVPLSINLVLITTKTPCTL